jgi:nucleotide-binding universal stress UspA family protein
MHGTLRAIYVVERDDGDGVSDARSMDQLRQSGMAIITRVAGLARAQGVEVEAAVLEGIPFEVILEDARRWKADLVLMGRTGRTGPGRALLGSEAERVLEFTDRPVLIVPATEAGPA